MKRPTAITQLEDVKKDRITGFWCVGEEAIDLLAYIASLESELAALKKPVAGEAEFLTALAKYIESRNYSRYGDVDSLTSLHRAALRDAERLEWMAANSARIIASGYSDGRFDVRWVDPMDHEEEKAKREGKFTDWLPETVLGFREAIDAAIAAEGLG